MSKPTKIKLLMRSDKELLLGLSRIGVSTGDMAYEYCKVNHDRLVSLEKSRYIKIEKVAINGQSNEVIHLTKFGQNFMHKNFGINYFPCWQTTHLFHDLRLSREYFELPQDIRQNWVHENTILRAHKDNISRGSCVDAIVTMPYRKFIELAKTNDRFQILNSSVANSLPLDDEISVAVEAIGSSYTTDMITEKYEVAATQLGCIAVITC